MRIIDAHVHIFLPRIALAAVMATNAFYEGCTNAEIPVAATLGHLPGTKWIQTFLTGRRRICCPA